MGHSDGEYRRREQGANAQGSVDPMPSDFEGYTFTLTKLGYAADLFAIITLGLSKVTTCLFYEGLFSQMQRRFIRAILLSIVIWIVLSVLLLAIRCTSKPWNDISSAQCSGLV